MHGVSVDVSECVFLGGLSALESSDVDLSIFSSVEFCRRSTSHQASERRDGKMQLFKLIKDFLHSSEFLAVLGGCVASIRAVLHDENKTVLHKFIDMLIGALIAYSCAEYFTPADHAKLALIVGLVAGTLGASILDNVEKTAPLIATTIVNMILEKLGIKKK